VRGVSRLRGLAGHELPDGSPRDAEASGELGDGDAGRDALDERHAIHCRPRASDPGASPLSCSHPRARPLADQVPLELGDGAQHVEEEPARGSARVDRKLGPPVHRGNHRGIGWNLGECLWSPSRKEPGKR
jgi:hypothetical protein